MIAHLPQDVVHIFTLRPVTFLSYTICARFLSANRKDQLICSLKAGPSVGLGCSEKIDSKNLIKFMPSLVGHDGVVLAQSMVIVLAPMVKE